MSSTNATERLTLALSDLEDKGVKWPCQNRPEWTSDDPDERAYAAAGCRFCPALALCAEAGDELRAQFVWGGTDRTKTQRKKAS